MATDLIDGYAAHLRSESRSQRTIGDRRRILTVLDTDLPLGLDLACAEELKEWLWRDGLTLSSRETYYGAIAGFYRWAYSADILDFNPAELLTRPRPPKRLPRPVTDEQLADVLGRACEPYQLWVLLAAYAGLRCVDIARLRREHITQERLMVWRSKGDKPRSVPTHQSVWDAVNRMPQGPITDHDERHISIRAAVYFSRSLHLPGVTLHRFRHWFGTTVQKLYRDLRVTQELMGHADPASTAGYALVVDQQKTAAIGLLPSFGVSAVAGSPEPEERSDRQ